MCLKDFPNSSMASFLYWIVKAYWTFVNSKMFVNLSILINLMLTSIHMWHLTFDKKKKKKRKSKFDNMKSIQRHKKNHYKPRNWQKMLRQMSNKSNDSLIITVKVSVFIILYITPLYKCLHFIMVNQQSIISKKFQFHIKHSHHHLDTP